jgi:hypothetical protein
MAFKNDMGDNMAPVWPRRAPHLAPVWHPVEPPVWSRLATSSPRRAPRLAPSSLHRAPRPAALASKNKIKIKKLKKFGFQSPRSPRSPSSPSSAGFTGEAARRRRFFWPSSPSHLSKLYSSLGLLNSKVPKPFSPFSLRLIDVDGF